MPLFRSCFPPSTPYPPTWNSLFPLLFNPFKFYVSFKTEFKLHFLPEAFLGYCCWLQMPARWCGRVISIWVSFFFPTTWRVCRQLWETSSALSLHNSCIQSLFKIYSMPAPALYTKGTQVTKTIPQGATCLVEKPDMQRYCDSTLQDIPCYRCVQNAVRNPAERKQRCLRWTGTQKQVWYLNWVLKDK